MKKKRNIFLLAVAVGVASLLVIGLLSTAGHSQPELVVQEVQAVVQDYGFTQVPAFFPLINSLNAPPMRESYETSGLTEDDFTEIYERIATVCISGEIEPNVDGASWSLSGQGQTSVYVTLSKTRYLETVSLDIVFYRPYKLSLRDRIRSWWPW